MQSEKEKNQTQYKDTKSLCSSGTKEYHILISNDYFQLDSPAKGKLRFLNG